MVSIVHSIGSTPLALFKTEDKFAGLVASHFGDVLGNYLLGASVDQARLQEAFHYWISDLNRVGDREYDGDHANPDHFKHAAHLAYWLRRSKPVIDVFQTEEFPSGADLSAADAYSAEHAFLRKYSNEYLAFDLGYHLALFYEVNAVNSTKRVGSYIIRDWEYFETVCYVLNSKNVSPHALNVVYRTVFASIG